jgi:hypothetical protein
MPRFFFHIRDGDRLIQDEEGQDHADAEEVRLTAVRSAREMLSQAALRGEAATIQYRLEIVDEAGREVLTMPVGHVVGTESQA